MSSTLSKTLNYTTIAILTDIHYGEPSTLVHRRNDIADILLLRAVHRLNRYIKPDVTVILGDILDNGRAPDSSSHRKLIRDILVKLESHLIVIPGNHDGDITAFYADFPRPQPIEQIANIRFLPFVDAEAPGFNATRSKIDMDRFQQARNDFDGMIVTLQHVCLHPEGSADIPYNFTNAKDIIQSMGQTGVTLSLSGHHHAGAESINDNGLHFVNAPGLCEYPFQFTIVTLENQRISTEDHQLAVPESLCLVDNHVHTQLAYCQENMTVERGVAFAKDVGLCGIGFAEHSGQLYFPQELYWGGVCYQTGIQGSKPQDNRMAKYLALKRKYGDGYVRFGMEVDIDYKGRLLLQDSDRREMDYVIGSVHSTPNIKNPDASESQLADEFMALLERLLNHNVDAIAHPFRVFRRAKLPTPEYLYKPVAELLAEYKVAAEINYHINEPPLQFIQLCLDRGVKFSLGSDAHNLYEVGEFSPHLQLLKDAGFDGDLRDIVLSL